MFKWIKKKTSPMSRGLAEKQEAVEKKLELIKTLMNKYGDRRCHEEPVEIERRRGDYELAH